MHAHNHVHVGKGKEEQLQLAQTAPVTSNPTAHVHNLLSSAKPRKAEKWVIVGFSNKPVLLLKHESEKAKYSHKHTHTRIEIGTQ